MQSSYVFIANVEKKRSMLYVASVLLLFFLNYEKDSGGTDYVFLQYNEVHTGRGKGG